MGESPSQPMSSGGGWPRSRCQSDPHHRRCTPGSKGLGSGAQCGPSRHNIIEDHDNSPGRPSGKKRNAAGAFPATPAGLMVTRTAVEEASHWPTGIAPHFSCDDLGLVEPSMAGSLWRRWRPRQHHTGTLTPDAVIDKIRKRWSKRPCRRPFASIFEIGHEGP